MTTTNANEPDSTVIGNVPVGLYYYYVPKDGASEATYLGFVDTIVSCSYNPFIDEADISDVRKSIFNVGKYGSPNGQIPYVKRICSNNTVGFQLGTTHEIFPEKSDLPAGFEPRVLTYPFRYFLITDFSSAPLLIKPEKIYSTNNQFEVRVRTSVLSSEGKYCIYVYNYKGDGDGNIEGMCSSTPMLLPVTSSAYSQFLATSSSSFNQGVSNALLENDVTLRQRTQQNALGYERNQTNTIMNGIMSGLSALTGNLVGGASGAFNATYNYQMNKRQNALDNHQAYESAITNEHNIVAMKNAKVNDLLNTPNSIKTAGNDMLFNLSLSNQHVDLLEYRCNITYWNQAQEYFKRYGYKVNDWRSLNGLINTRLHYNYIKTSVCNISSGKIPVEYLEEIKSIFNEGLTIWHMDNEGTTMFDYDTDNTEVY